MKQIGIAVAVCALALFLVMVYFRDVSYPKRGRYLLVALVLFVSVALVFGLPQLSNDYLYEHQYLMYVYIAGFIGLIVGVLGGIGLIYQWVMFQTVANHGNKGMYIGIQVVIGLIGVWVVYLIWQAIDAMNRVG